MNINPAQTSPHQAMGFQKGDCLLMTGYRRLREGREGTQHLVSLREVPARQLSDNKHMCPDLRLFQQFHQGRAAST